MADRPCPASISGGVLFSGGPADFLVVRRVAARGGTLQRAWLLLEEPAAFRHAHSSELPAGVRFEQLAEWNSPASMANFFVRRHVRDAFAHLWRSDGHWAGSHQRKANDGNADRSCALKTSYRGFLVRRERAGLRIFPGRGHRRISGAGGRVVSRGRLDRLEEPLL